MELTVAGELPATSDQSLQTSQMPPAMPVTVTPAVSVAPQWPPANVGGPTWSATSAAATSPVVRRKSGSARVVDAVFALSVLVAVGGVAFAIGRETAPKSAATTGTGVARGGFGAGAGQGTGGSDQNAIVVPGASGAPTVPTQEQPVASGVPVIPDVGTGTGTGIGTGTGTGTGTPSVPGAPTRGGLGGFGRGGLTGTVSAVGDGLISFTSESGQSTDVATADTTTYHQQVAASVADVAVGSFVRITVDGGFGGGFGGGQPGAPAAPATSAAPGAGTGATAMSATDVEILLAAPEQAAGGRRGGLSGTVSAVGDGTITIAMADGQTTEVVTTETTTIHRQAAATAADVTVGSSIRITAAGGLGGGFGGGQPGAPAASTAPGAGAGTAALSASDVEILLPTGQ